MLTYTHTVVQFDFMKTTREKFKSGILVLQSSADMQQNEFFMRFESTAA